VVAVPGPPGAAGGGDGGEQAARSFPSAHSCGNPGGVCPEGPRFCPGARHPSVDREDGVGSNLGNLTGQAPVSQPASN